jgi:hypothetical protein
MSFAGIKMSILLPFTLSAILTTDPLGYECVPEEKLETAFSLGSKGMRLPQTCIPEPCKQTFSEATLASYSGFQDDAHYRDYRSRMSSVCGAPTVWDEKGITREQLLWAAFDGGSGSIPLPVTASQDDPNAAKAPARAAVRKKGSGIDGIGGGRGFGIGAGGGRQRSFFTESFRGTKPGGAAIISVQSPGQTIDEDQEREGPNLPAPVPLPAPFFLLAAAAIALALVKRLWLGTVRAVNGRV